MAALAQAIAATAGFLIAGVPGAMLLGVVTFFLSIVPIVYCGAYLRSAASIISSGTYLISHGSHLSLLLIVLGVTGGIAAFAFIGIFIGPPILVVGLTQVRLWTVHSVKAAENHHKNLTGVSAG